MSPFATIRLKNAFLFYMNQPVRDNNLLKALSLVLCAGLLISFFLPWVSWDGSMINGHSMPTGEFFALSGKQFGLNNPFPKLSFAFAIFWLIPVLAIITAMMSIFKKKTVPFAFIAGALSLALLTVFFLFTSTLTDLGVGDSVFAMLKPAAFLQAISGVALILFAFPVKTVFPKILWLLIGPVLAWGSYKAGEKYIMGETHVATQQVTADFTVTADALIHEFLSNDTAANKKYLEKVIIVHGRATAVDLQEDSTSTIRFEDSTKCYVIFSLEKNQVDEIMKIKPGDTVSIKGVCSGSIFSEILETTSISFKRATLNKKL